MQKKLLKSVALLMVIPGLFLLFSCAETEVQSTTPDAPKAQLSEDVEETGKDAADEEAASEAAQRAVEEEAIEIRSAEHTSKKGRLAPEQFGSLRIN